jgi:hypothetical protein
MNFSWINAYSDAVHTFKWCDFSPLHTKITVLDEDEEEEEEEGEGKKKKKRQDSRMSVNGVAESFK